MEVYVTKYALTQGILIEDAEYLDNGYWKVEGHYSLYNKNECFTDKESAIKNAEERRIKKLQSLDKQIKKYSAMSFDI